MPIKRITEVSKKNKVLAPNWQYTKFLAPKFLAVQGSVPDPAVMNFSYVHTYNILHKKPVYFRYHLKSGPLELLISTASVHTYKSHHLELEMKFFEK